MDSRQPSLIVSTTLVFILTLFWGYVRLYLFPENVLPLTFVLPLLTCIWTGRRWQLWSMAAVFSVMAYAKTFHFLPQNALSDQGDLLFLGSTLFNIFVGAIVVQEILKLKENLEKRNATISAQNAELETQTEELSQQNEEIKAQAEELGEQNEEIEAQTEETSRQNEDLVELNKRLSGREEILQGLLNASRKSDSVSQVLQELCYRVLAAVGVPASGVAILEQKENSLLLLTQVTQENTPPIPAVWSFSGTIAEIVLKEKRTAYVFDLAQPTEFRPLFTGEDSFRSILVTPIMMPDAKTDLLVICSTTPSHWTKEQFRLVEWIAAQCGLIMEILRSKNALAEHAKALETASKAKDNFLAMLSHELRTPITPVLTVAGMLENDGRLPIELQDDFKMIRRNIGVQSKLIDDLLDLTRIGRGKIELDRQVLSIESLLSDTAMIVSNDLAAKSQPLKLDLSGVSNLYVEGDGARLQQVFWNLLKNAIKFSDHDQPILLRGNVENDWVRIEVSDSGRGISPENLERIFLPFEQAVDVPRKANEAGLGLGLAIAKAVVELHGGKVSAKSQGCGHGATFIVELPAYKKQPATTSSRNAPANQTASSDSKIAAKILLVEDHGDTGRAMTRMLQNAGYLVDHAETAASALALFNEKEFDLVISDLGLPDESGLVLIKRLREIQPTLRAICLSGYGMEENIAACHEAGFQEHLTKPIQINRLKAVITKILTPSSGEKLE